MMENKEKEIKLDNDLYSRSIFTYGIDTMKKLLTTKVLIVGMRGLGVETAKNIILNGIGEVDIFDPSLVKINDLGSNFYLSENDVGSKNRDEASLLKLSDLNPYVKVSIFEIDGKKDIIENYKLFCKKIEKYNVVVFTELQPITFISEVDKICRMKNIKLIYGFCFGLVGYIFTDFGPNHTIFDENGEEIKEYYIKNISKDKEGLVEIDDIQKTTKLDIGDGEFVKFKKVGGMIELNDENKEYQITYKNYKSFQIGDTSKFSDYTKGGVVYQVKKPKMVHYLDFLSRVDNISDPNHPLIGSDKKGRNELLYLAFRGVHDFYMQNKYSLPELNNMEQANIILEKVKKRYNDAKENKITCFEEMEEFNEKTVLNVARWAAANIQPVCAFFGGILAQEIIKTTGKYIPIDQWFIHDFFETVENVKDDADRKLKNCRYDDQIAIFGNEIQEKIQKSKLFMVGAGATSCEFLKNSAMMGFCSENNAKFTVTDNDNIEISNLSRQFLFRKDNVGKSKSIIAIDSVKKMNPNFNGEGMQAKFCDETEQIFNEDFFNEQNIIAYAVDSIETRKYIDKKVILYQKFSVDAGTLGTTARSKIIIPHKTSTYNDIAPSGESIKIPSCTLRHFPSLIQHCIERSKDSFYGLFGNIISEVREFFVDFNKFKEKIKREGIPQHQLEKLTLLKMHIDMIVNNNINKMCEYAIQNYTNDFDHYIQELLISFPPNYKNRDGSDFWVGSKRLPHPIPFNTDIDLCLIYVTKFVQILSQALGIHFTKEQLSLENIKKICSTIKFPEFKKKIFKIDLNEKENKKEEKNHQPKEDNLSEQLKINSEEQKKAQKEIDEIMNELDKIKREKFDIKKINPVVFEKDHDENGHIDFINADANLRARNYGIDECDRNKTKKIAGNIIPTILTTTASIAGVVSLQFYTMLQTNEIKYFRDCVFHLHSNTFYFLIPSEPKKIKDCKFDSKLNRPIKAIPEEWNSWDRIEIKGSKTCGEFIDYLKKTYNIDVDMLVADDVVIISTFLESGKAKMELKLEDIYEKKAKKKISEKRNYLNILVIGSIDEAKIGEEILKGVSVSMPIIKYIFR